MKLEDLLGYDDIVIQCHDKPDVDTVASGYALLKYLKRERPGKKSPLLVYSGAQKGTRGSLREMIQKFDIPLTYLTELEEDAELLVLVDCQPGEGNVTRLSYKNLAVIDHHSVKHEERLPKLREIRTEADGYASCATVLWAMLKEARYPVEMDDQLPTILYYGMRMDTQGMGTARQKDKDMAESLKCDTDIVAELEHASLSLEEIQITGRAYNSLHIHTQHRFSVAQVESCDPDILGIVSDELMKVAGVDVSAAYCMQEDGSIKVSVRCYRAGNRADDLVSWLVRDLGGDGGGAPTKAAGRMSKAFLEEACAGDDWDDLSGAAGRLIYRELTKYFDMPPQKISTGEYSPEKALEFCSGGTARYQKKKVPVGYVKATELFPLGTDILIRMLEGDVRKKVTPELYIMIGVNGETYHSAENKLREKYELKDDPFFVNSESPWQPKIYRYSDREVKLLAPYAKTCFAKPEKAIRASQLDCRLLVRTIGGEEQLGEPGDWLVSQEEINPQDIYIVKNTIFQRTYGSIEE